MELLLPSCPTQNPTKPSTGKPPQSHRLTIFFAHEGKQALLNSSAQICVLQISISEKQNVHAHSFAPAFSADGTAFSEPFVRVLESHVGAALVCPCLTGSYCILAITCIQPILTVMMKYVSLDSMLWDALCARPDIRRYGIILWSGGIECTT